jgi:hypothetical protein
MISRRPSTMEDSRSDAQANRKHEGFKFEAKKKEGETGRNGPGAGSWPREYSHRDDDMQTGAGGSNPTEPISSLSLSIL